MNYKKKQLMSIILMFTVVTEWTDSPQFANLLACETVLYHQEHINVWEGMFAHLGVS
jgi:hypothetical protein